MIIRNTDAKRESGKQILQYSGSIVQPMIVGELSYSSCYRCPRLFIFGVLPEIIEIVF